MRVMECAFALMCLCSFQLRSGIEETVGLLLKDLKNYSNDVKAAAVAPIYRASSDEAKEEIVDQYATELNMNEEDVKNQFQKEVTPAAKAPEGVSDSFKAVVEKVARSKPEDIPEYTADALRYLFGDDPQTMELPDEAKGKAKEQPGSQLEQAASVEASFKVQK